MKKTLLVLFLFTLILAKAQCQEVKLPAHWPDSIHSGNQGKMHVQGVAVDESRLITEIAIMADKSSIDEEIVRLRSHVAEFEKTLDSQSSIGRKLDFIVQEMNREVNTIGSKATDIDIINNVVNLKTQIEKIREQIQNIE